MLDLIYHVVLEGVVKSGRFFHLALVKLFRRFGFLFNERVELQQQRFSVFNLHRHRNIHARVRNDERRNIKKNTTRAQDARSMCYDPSADELVSDSTTHESEKQRPRSTHLDSIFVDNFFDFLSQNILFIEHVVGMQQVFRFFCARFLHPGLAGVVHLVLTKRAQGRRSKQIRQGK